MEPIAERRVRFSVNGTPVQVSVEPRRTLLDCLRDDLHLYGTHVGCEHGVCGCCNVTLDGELVRSCLIFATQVEGADVGTIEGIETEDGLSPLQEAFCSHHAMQCGYCTPGMIMAVDDLLRHNPHPTRDDVVDAISANLCRCTGYQQIVDAVLSLVDPAEQLVGG